MVVRPYMAIAHSHIIHQECIAEVQLATSKLAIYAIHQTLVLYARRLGTPDYNVSESSLSVKLGRYFNITIASYVVVSSNSITNNSITMSTSNSATFVTVSKTLNSTLSFSFVAVSTKNCKFCCSIQQPFCYNDFTVSL